MMLISNEYQLQLTFQTFKKDLQLNIYRIAQLYNIPHTTLTHRINDRSIYVDTIANSRKLTALKEKMIVQKIFNLNSQRFSPQIHNMENIANRLLTILLNYRRCRDCLQ